MTIYKKKKLKIKSLKIKQEKKKRGGPLAGLGWPNHPPDHPMAEKRKKKLKIDGFWPLGGSLIFFNF